MGEKNLKKNFIYNIIYQVLIIFLPLITTPIITRRLGATNLGIYSYSYSIVNYFMLFGILGISNYGNREIAKCRDDRKKLSTTFWSIYKIQFLFSFLVTILYILYTIFLSKYKIVSYIQLFFIISVFFDINWFFFGLEDFKITVSRNILIKIISFILIILLVLNSDDLWKYTIIMSLSTFLSQFILWLFLFKRINHVKVRLKDGLKHLKKILIFFIPVISYSIYKIMDKIMIGFLSEIEAVAFYENAEKIANIPIAIITALGTVMLPRISNLVAKNEHTKVKDYINKSFQLVLFIIIPIILLILLYGKELCVIYLGSEFEQSGFLLQLLSSTILFVSLANVIRTQFLIPYSKDKDYIYSTIIGAILNLILNLIFIPRYGATGACIGTIAAEFSVMFYQIYSTRKDLNYKYLIKQLLLFTMRAIIPALIVIFIPSLTKNRIFDLFIHCALYMIFYALINIKYALLLLKSKDF